MPQQVSRLGNPLSYRYPNPILLIPWLKKLSGRL